MMIYDKVVTNGLAHLALLILGVGMMPLAGCGEIESERLERAGEAVREAGQAVKQAGERVKEAATDLVLPPEQEEQLGDRMAREIAAESTLLRDSPVGAYVERLGQGLLAAADRPDAIDFDFHVLRDEAINAFAIPGGHIYVTTGLLRAAETESELVAVLAHEIAHVTERHIAERLTAAYGVTALTRLVVGQDSGALERLAADLLTRGFLLKYSRDHEREADAAGLRTVVAAGHSPRGYVAFFQRLAEQPTPPALLSTHPNPGERVENARRAMAGLDAAVLDRPLHGERYQAVVGALSGAR